MVMATAAAEAEANVRPIDDEVAIGNSADLRWSRLSPLLLAHGRGVGAMTTRYRSPPAALAAREPR